MPELPEVQTVVNVLKSSKIINKTISETKIFVPKMLKNSSVSAFNDFLVGEKIKTISRIGKYLVFNLTDNKVMLMHLRMEGKIFVEQKKDTPRKYLCFEIFIGNEILRFYDFRKFGTVHIYKSEKEMKESIVIKKIALDPLDKNFSGTYLYNNLKNSNKYIKTAILDQSKVSGIGNVYADEILFRSRISPLRKTKNVSLKEFNTIAKYAKSIMEDSIKHGGTTFATFESANHTVGAFQNKLQMYGKKICPVCKRPTVYTKVNGRGTHYCKHCQK
ncbi:MAG: DNA-formamidopyrimidine glycosylase [Mycoplasmataceae bacterium]|jgi:formamidopyrimidine-DNA glycosylase|nr:DNA-formamidopyrimidine glycosylase [Mycoplasmataceae bacterium]